MRITILVSGCLHGLDDKVVKLLHGLDDKVGHDETDGQEAPGENKEEPSRVLERGAQRVC